MPNPRVEPLATLASDPDTVADKLGNGVAVAASRSGAVRVAGSTEVLRPGSITKVLTATALMQCVDTGLLQIDDPVSRWVPGIDATITLRHLLSHSSGIDAGDVFVDTGDDDDCLARYAELVAEAGSLFTPGHTFSYCNAGILLAGHITALAR